GLVPNSPRYSAGASGLGSHISMWLGPPRIHNRMTELTRAGALGRAAFASARSSWGRVMPAAPSAPARRKPRRPRRSFCPTSAQPRRVVPWLGMVHSPRTHGVTTAVAGGRKADRRPPWRAPLTSRHRRKPYFDRNGSGCRGQEGRVVNSLRELLFQSTREAS